MHGIHRGILVAAIVGHAMFGPVLSAALAQGARPGTPTAPTQAPKSPPAPTPSRPGPGPDPIPDVGDLELMNMIRVVGEPTDVDELLSALETADRGLKTFQSSVMYDRRFLLQGDRHVRYGSLYFQFVVKEPEAGRPAPRPRRMFAIDFVTLYIDGAKRDDRHTWIFDGQWLIERRPTQKTWVARQVAREDDPIDPLGLGESPIPFPIGQRKEAILARYQAFMLPAADGLDAPKDADQQEKQQWNDLRQAAKETYQLRLIPRAENSADDEFKEIRLWYTKDRLLPRLARTVNRAGDESIVLLASTKINEDLPAHALDRQAPDPKDGWDVQVIELRARDQ